MTPPGSPPEADDFGALAVVLGFLSPEQRDGVFRIQKELAQSGVPRRFGEVCLERRLLNRQQIFLILQAQGKRVLSCEACRKTYNVHGYSARETAALILRMMEKDRDRRPEPGEIARALTKALSSR